jgi:alpha-L-fucosidase
MNRRDFTKMFAATGLWAAATATLLGLVPGKSAARPVTAASSRLLRAQQAFLDLRFGMFIHLNMASYEEREWGDPKLSPRLFNPVHLDTDQWARAARSANMSYGCLTTKHHDGFCLWPTATASANVMQSSYPHDVVRAYVDAFRAHGLKPCLYFSMLDLRADIRAHQVTPEKVALIKAQLTELLTQYGPITALIFDGWNASWSRIGYDQLPYREIYDLVKRLQPDCLVTDHNAGRYPGPALYYTDIKQYEQHAGQKIPPHSPIPSQSGTTLQSDWFWKQSYPTEALRPARQIVDEWLIPFNRNHCNLILNVAPNRDGRFDDNAVERLAEIGRLWKNEGPAPRIDAAMVITTRNLGLNLPSFASSIEDATGPDLAFDDDLRTYWMADKGQSSAWLEVRFDRPTVFNTVAIVEPVGAADYGDTSRIADYKVQYAVGDSWRDLIEGHSPRPFQFHAFEPITAERVRLQLAAAGAPPGIAEFGIYNEPAIPA